MKKLFTPFLLLLTAITAQASETITVVQLDSILIVDPSISGSDSVEETSIFIWSETNRITNNYYLEFGDTVYKATYQYDEGLLSSWIEEYAENEVWVNDSKYRYVYNASDEKTHVYESDYDDIDGWEENFYTEYTYTESGQVESETNYRLSDGVWAGAERFEYIYNESGARLSNTELRYRTGDWAPKVKFEYTLDDDGFVTEAYEYSYINASEEWEIEVKYTYAYDAQGNLTNETGYFTKDDQGNWQVSLELEYIYDLSQSHHVAPFFEFDISQPEFPEYIHNRIVGHHFVEYDQEDIDHEYWEYFYYSEAIVEAPTEPEGPQNPGTFAYEHKMADIVFSNDEISYQTNNTAEMKVVGMNGSVYITQKSTGSVFVSTASLPQGAYFVSIKENGSVQTTSIVIE